MVLVVLKYILDGVCCEGTNAVSLLRVVPLHGPHGFPIAVIFKTHIHKNYLENFKREQNKTRIPRLQPPRSAVWSKIRFAILLHLGHVENPMRALYFLSGGLYTH